MVFLRCGNEFIYVVSVCVRTKGAGSAQVPSTEQLQGVTGGLVIAAGIFPMCPRSCCAGDDHSLALG